MREDPLCRVVQGSVERVLVSERSSCDFGSSYSGSAEYFVIDI